MRWLRVAMWLGILVVVDHVWVDLADFSDERLRWVERTGIGWAGLAGYALGPAAGFIAPAAVAAGAVSVSVTAGRAEWVGVLVPLWAAWAAGAALAAASAPSGGRESR